MNNIVEILRKEKEEIQNNTNQEIKILDRLIKKYDTPIIVENNRDIEPRVKRRYSKRTVVSNLSVNIPSRFDENLSIPQKILFVVNKDGSATNNTISVYLFKNQINNKTTYEQFYNQVKYTSLKMARKGILSCTKRGNESYYSLVKKS